MHKEQKTLSKKSQLYSLYQLALAEGILEYFPHNAIQVNF